MNAHQRRVNKRSKRCVFFDIESNFFIGGEFRPLVGDFFDFASIRTGRTLTAVAPDFYCARIISGEVNGIEPLSLSHTIKILKQRPAKPGSEFVFSQEGFDMDFTKLEELISQHVAQESVPSLYTTGTGRGIDCHRQKAAEMFNVAYDDVTPEQRAAGKNANYIDWYVK